MVDIPAPLKLSNLSSSSLPVTKHSVQMKSVGAVQPQDKPLTLRFSDQVGLSRNPDLNDSPSPKPLKGRLPKSSTQPSLQTGPVDRRRGYTVNDYSASTASPPAHARFSLSRVQKKSDLPRYKTPSHSALSDRRRRNNSTQQADQQASKTVGFLKSETTTALGSPRPYRSKIPKSKTAGTGLVTKGSGAWAAKQDQSSSPLKERIGLFESLSRRVTVPQMSAKNATNAKPSSVPKVKRKPSGSKAARFRETLRRISASLEKRRSKSSSGDDTLQTQIFRNEEPPIITDTVRKRVISKAIRSMQSSSTQTSLHGTDLLLASSSTAAFNDHTMPGTSGQHWAQASPNSQGKHETGPKSESPEHGFNVDGSSRVLPRRRITKEQYRSHRWSSRGMSSSSGSSQGFTNHHSWRRRWISRSGDPTPTVSKVTCRLEQPRPVRASEMRRIVSLCKDRAARLSRGQSE